MLSRVDRVPHFTGLFSIAAHYRALPHRSRERLAPLNVPETSIDELDNVERHFSQGKQLSDRFGIRVYEPQLVQNGEILQCLRKNLSHKVNDIKTIAIYEGHKFLIKDIKKLAKLYACVDCHTRFTKCCDLQRHAKTCAQGKAVIDCPNERVKPRTQHTRECFTTKARVHRHQFTGLSP